MFSEIITQNKHNDSVVKFIGDNKNTINNKAKYLDFEFKENYLTIEVKLHTNMNNLNNVYVIESLYREEFQKIKKLMVSIYLLILKRFIFLSSNSRTDF